jgi:hypothetical protein
MKRARSSMTTPSLAAAPGDDGAHRKGASTLGRVLYYILTEQRRLE